MSLHSLRLSVAILLHQTFPPPATLPPTPATVARHRPSKRAEFGPFTQIRNHEFDFTVFTHS
jgi:hypothetical protein